MVKTNYCKKNTQRTLQNIFKPCSHRYMKDNEDNAFPAFTNL